MAGSKFTISGREGLPNNPNEPLRSDAISVNFIDEVVETRPQSNNETGERSQISDPTIVEATYWIVDTGGNVVLAANSSIATPHDSWQKIIQCKRL